MIRLWHRVGTFRALSILVLVAALVGGLVIADRQTQRSTANANPASAADTLTAPASPAPSATPDADTQDAQAKANDAASAAAAQAKAAEEEARRKQDAASRSKTRTPGPPVGYAGPIPSSCEIYRSQNPNGQHKAAGCAIMLSMGFGLDQAPCLVKLWVKESGWNPLARNRSSGAYGIPQALPGNKMASAGPNWQSDVATQVKWGLGYIKGRYGTPCGAWAHSQSKGWY